VESPDNFLEIIKGIRESPLVESLGKLLLSHNLYFDKRKGKRKANWRNLRLSYHCHLNRIPLSI
jgi:hypothetical protein